MNLKDDNHEDLEAEELALAESGVARLLDIVTQEVSLVNRAANRRKWLVRKGMDAMNVGQEVFQNEDGTMTTEAPTASESAPESPVEKQMAMPAAVKAAVASALETALAKATKLVSEIKAMTEDESVEGMPQMLANEFKGLATGLRAIVSRYPAPKAKGEQSPEEGEEGEESSAESEEATAEKAGHAISGAMKKKAMEIAEEATNKLTSLVAKVKGAEESDDAPGMPAEIAQAIEDVAAGIGAGAGGSYPSPKAQKTDDAPPHTAAPPATPPEVTEETEDMEKSSPFSILQQAKSVLGVVMSKLQPGQPLDEDSYQKLDKLRSLLGTSAPKESKEEETGEEKGDVKKAGAKMAQARRKRLEEAIKSLLSLFKDVMPNKDLGKFPHLVVSKSETEAETLRKSLEETQAELTKAREEIASLKDRPAGSQAAPVEALPPANGGSEDVRWPLDLNAE